MENQDAKKEKTINRLVLMAREHCVQRWENAFFFPSKKMDTGKRKNQNCQIITKEVWSIVKSYHAGEQAQIAFFREF